MNSTIWVKIERGLQEKLPAFHGKKPIAVVQTFAHLWGELVCCNIFLFCHNCSFSLGGVGHRQRNKMLTCWMPQLRTPQRNGSFDLKCILNQVFSWLTGQVQMNCIWWNHNGLYSWTVPIDWVPLSRLLDLQTAQWLWKWAIVITCPTIYIKDFIATLCKCVVTCNIYIPCVNPSTKHPTTIIRYTHLLMASFRTHSHFIVIALRIFNCVYNFIILIAIFSLLHAQNLYALYITCMHTSFNCFHAFRFFLKWKKKIQRRTRSEVTTTRLP